MARRPTPDRDRPASRTRPLSARAIVIACLVAIGVPVAAGVLIDRHTGNGDGGGDSSTTTTAKPPPLSRAGSVVVHDDRPLTGGDPPATLAIEYRVESHDGSRPTVSTQRITVRRPFDARIEQRTGAPPGLGSPVVRITRLGALAVSQPSGPATVLSPAPAPAGSDLRPDISLHDATAAGLVEARELREVAGRICRVYRSGGAITSGEITPAAGSAERDEFCVDGDGLVLEDVWWKGEAWLQRRLAVSVDEAPAVDDDLFRFPAEELVPFDQGNGSVRPIEPGSLPTGRGWRLPSPPEGFALVGSYAVSPVQSKAPGTTADALQDPTLRDTASVIDVYQRGRDVLEVEQGIAASPEVAHFRPTGAAADVDLGALGRGQSVLDLRANEARAGFADGRFVRVFGTLPLADVLSAARSLQPVEGEGVHYL